MDNTGTNDLMKVEACCWLRAQLHDALIVRYYSLFYSNVDGAALPSSSISPIE
jgi:hypothetical protein